jgi:hypothetical protein
VKKGSANSRLAKSSGKARCWPVGWVASLALAGVAVGLIVWASLRKEEPAKSKPPLSAAAARHENFVGSEACAGCHAKEYAAWRDSTHGRAGGAPGDVELIARFDGQPLRFKDAVVTPQKKSGGELVFAVEDAAGDAFEILVDAVVGGGHMQGGGTQSFFQRFSDGTVRFLPLDYIRKENQWFVQLRKDLTWAPISTEISFYGDLANWPPNRVLGTPITMSNCQNCHGSQITTSYNEQKRRYETHYRTLQINCESCHGPGRRHIEIVSKPGFERLREIGMEPLSTLSKDQSLGVCFQCHATKTALREEPYLQGDRFEDYFSLLLPLFSEEPFTVDGRVRSFGYQSNHLFSDCYLNGSMTCVDCHDPHSQGYRDVFGRTLVGRFDNRQCTSCHASKARGTSHSHHKADSPGNQCTSCHMPYLQHRGVGQHFTFARSDHTIPIPRPAFDQQLGIENACQKCHSDRDLGWQESKISEWYGGTKPQHALVAGFIRSRDFPDPDFTRDLLLTPEANHPMAQMRGLGTFIKRFVRPGRSFNDPAAIRKLQEFARHENLDLKALGLMALHVGYSERPEIRAFLDGQLAALGTNAAAIRARWVVAAGDLGSALASNNDPQSGIQCLLKSLEIVPDSVVTMAHLARAYHQAGKSEEAIATLQKAIAIKPATANLHFQLGQIHAQLGRIPQAIESLERGLLYAPDDKDARFLLEKLRELSREVAAPK